MKRSNKIYSRASLFLLHRGIAFFVMVFFFLFGSLPGAEKNARKVVRVAYQEFNRQMIVDEHNNPVSGYAYDYIQTIGTYAGWDLKYIPCDSFADSVKKLLAGEVDLIYEISYTEERAKEILAPTELYGRSGFAPPFLRTITNNQPFQMCA